MTRIATRALAALWLALALLSASAASAADGTPDANGPVLHVFWSLTCPVCIRQKPWIDALEARFPGLAVDAMELSRSEDNHARFEEMAAQRGIRAEFVPTLMLGSDVWVGDTPAQRAQIEAAIAATLAGVEPAPDNALRLPIWGEVDAAAASLAGVTVLIAFVDGFNPCSLWVLTLLLGMVIASGSRKRVAVVGVSFLLTTALIYGAFIAGLFSVMAWAFALPWVRWAVALFALGFGLVSIKDYFWHGRGVSFSIPEGQKPGIYARIRQLRQQDLGTPALITATVGMAAGIALVELPCTAGFPVIWSGILAERGVIAGAGFWGFLALYVLIYLGVELVIFAVAVTGMSLGRMGERHGRALKLVGGMVMVALAGALALKPGLMEDLTGSLLLFGAALGVALVVLMLHDRTRLDA
ncbi:MAG: hypothetical protein JJT99_00910 [Rhodobacteraceae bacterium]|nr:hypothetical protein [Paracoccaceae bacterium]